MPLLIATSNPGKAREFADLFRPLALQCLSLADLPKVLEPEESAPTFLTNACLKATAYAKAHHLHTLADDSGLEVDALNGAPGVHSAYYAFPQAYPNSSNPFLTPSLHPLAAPQQREPQQKEPKQCEPQQGDPHQGDPQQGDPQRRDPKTSAVPPHSHPRPTDSSLSTSNSQLTTLPPRPIRDPANCAHLLAQLASTPDPHRTARFVCTLALSDPQGRILLTARGTVEGQILHAPRGTNGFGYDPLFLIPTLNKTTAELTSKEKHTISHRGAATRQLLALLKAHPLAL